MKSSRSLLRLLVFVGSPVLLGKAPKVRTVRADDTCQQYSNTETTYSCPSGCTSPNYMTYYPIRSGTYNPIVQSYPCSPQSCSQPYAVSGSNEDCLDCGVPDGGTCYSGGVTECCADPYAICNQVYNVCCVSEGETCSGDSDCCPGYVCDRSQSNCTDCVQPGDYADSAGDCCSGTFQPGTSICGGSSDCNSCFDDTNCEPCGEVCDDSTRVCASCVPTGDIAEYQMDCCSGQANYDNGYWCE